MSTLNAPRSSTSTSFTTSMTTRIVKCRFVFWCGCPLKLQVFLKLHYKVISCDLQRNFTHFHRKKAGPSRLAPPWCPTFRCGGSCSWAFRIPRRRKRRSKQRQVPRPCGKALRTPLMTSSLTLCGFVMAWPEVPECSICSFS